MYLELFVNKQETEEYLNVLKISAGSEKEDISPRLRREIMSSFEFTKKLGKDYDLMAGPRVLYALRNDKKEIIGTIALAEDGHCGRTAHMEYAAIRKDSQKHGYGRFMPGEIEKEIVRHSSFRYAVLTTVNSGDFYEKCGMCYSCTLEPEDCPRRFYVKELSREREAPTKKLP